MKIFGATSGNGVEVNSDNALKVQARAPALGNNGAYQAALTVAPMGAIGTGAWTATGSIGTTSVHGTCMCLLQNGQVLLVCGDTTQACYLYNPNTGVWTATGSTTAAVQAGSMCLLPNGQVLLACGNTGTVCNLYDPNTGVWTLTGAATHAVLGGSMCLLPNGQVLLACGDSTVNCCLYNVNTGKWIATGALPTGSLDSMMCVLPNGNVLLSIGSASTFNIYYPSSGVWLPTGSTASSVSVASGAMCLLPNGLVLLACGGASGSTSVQYYNPLTATWTVAGAISSTYLAGCMCVLPNGKVLAACGNASNASSLYTLNTNAWTLGLTIGSATVEFGSMCLLQNGLVLLVAGDTTSNCYLYTPATSTILPNSDLASMYWNTTGKLCLIRKIRVQAATTAVSGTNAAFDLALFFARNYTVPDSGVTSFGLPYNSTSSSGGGTNGGNVPPSVAIAPNGNYSGSLTSASSIGEGNVNTNKVRTSMSQSQIGDLRFGQCGALAQGTYVLDAFPLARVQGWDTQAQVGPQIFGQGTDGSGFVNLLDRPPGTHPIVLAPNEGLVIQTPTGYQGSSFSMVIEIEWEEVASY